MQISNQAEYEEALRQVSYFLHHADEAYEPREYERIDQVVDALQTYEAETRAPSLTWTALGAHALARLGCTLNQCIDPNVFILSGDDGEPLKKIVIGSQDFDKTDVEKWETAHKESMAYLESG